MTQNGKPSNQAETPTARPQAKTFLAYIRKSVIEGETASPARQRAAIERRVL